MSDRAWQLLIAAALTLYCLTCWGLSIYAALNH